MPHQMAGGCAASIAQDDWLALNGLAEEKEEHVRFDRKGEEPPSNMHDGRAVAAPIASKLNGTTMFYCRFFKGKHINFLELESLISLHRRVTLESVRARQLLVLVDSRVVSGAVSKGRSRSLTDMDQACLALRLSTQQFVTPLSTCTCTLC